MSAQENRLAKASNAVTQFLKEHIEASGKTQAHIAREVGLDARNMVSMMKTGKAKVPLERARLLARSVGADEVEFACLVLRTYTPEFWAVVEDIIAHDRYERAAMLVVRKRAKSAVAETEKAEADNEVK